MKKTSLMPLAFSILIVFLMTAGLNLYALAQTTSDKVVRPDEIIVMPWRIIAPPVYTNPITLKDYHVAVSVHDNVATTTIEQSFVNNTARTLEAKYLYPLPADANFSTFTLSINGQAVEGKILDKDEAHRTYLSMVQKYIDPGLLEYIDDKTVQASIAPIFAGEEKKIKLSYTQVLKQDGGLYKYQYPLGLKSGQQIPFTQAGLDVTLNTAQPLKTIYSPSHSPKIDRHGDKEATVSLDLSDQKAFLENKFILYFSEDNQAVTLNSLAFKEPVDDNGYFLMTIRTPKEMINSKPLPKNVVLVLDTSGSMSGSKIKQAKEALGYVVNHLRAQDSFNIVQFNTDVSMFKPALVSPNTENRQAALDYVNHLEADGSTNIEGALKAAFQQLSKNSNGRPQYVIFLTDGEPTVGVTDTDGLLKVAKAANLSDAKLFDFGVGYDVKTDLLGKLATAHHGTTTYVEPDENLELALTGFYTKIETPVLSDVKVDFGNFNVSKVYPSEIGDLFAGSDVILLGRFGHAGAGHVRLTGKVGNEARTFTYPVSWEPEKVGSHASLPRLWAGRRIGYLLENIHQNGESPEIKNEVVSLSKQYGIMTPYTSFLAMEPGTYNPNDSRRDVGNGYRQMPAASPMASKDNYKMSSGQAAVQLQQSLGRMQQQASAADMNEAQMAGVSGSVLGVQTLGSKTFVLSKEGVWTDADYDASRDGEPQRVTFGSSEYFRLLADKPELAKFFSLGQQVLVILDGKAYQVIAPKSA